MQSLEVFLVAEWIYFTLFGILLPAIKLKVYTLGGLRTQQLSFGLGSLGFKGGIF